MTDHEQKEGLEKPIDTAKAEISVQKQSAEDSTDSNAVTTDNCLESSSDDKSCQADKKDKKNQKGE